MITDLLAAIFRERNPPSSQISRLVNQGIEKLPPSKVCSPETPLKMFRPGASAPPAPPPPFNPAMGVTIYSSLLN